jgi:hypothetical protein
MHQTYTQTHQQLQVSLTYTQTQQAMESIDTLPGAIVADAYLVQDCQLHSRSNVYQASAGDLSSSAAPATC